ncbi:MAG: hypothetical protein FWG70_04325 [Oscillospiraceae bacterium]|nr:hypothetical protein [Oscillospiraceae bacterium]
MRVLNIIITLIFFASMVVLTVTARDIHNALLPQVTARRLTQEDFEFVIDFEYDGIPQTAVITQKRLAIPKELYNPDTSDAVFVVTTIYINGEERVGVRRVVPQTNEKNEGFYEVTGGISRSDFVIFTSSKVLEDGAEVFILAS